ncbi:hypothetical protein ScPMuIL_018347 [Solemya velum]
MDLPENFWCVVLLTPFTMDHVFAGKTALVTGAGRGIGRAVTKALCDRGAKVYALSKTECNLDSLKSEIPSVETICVDLSDWEATRDAVKAIEAVDFLVNNAGVALVKSFLETTKEDIDCIFDVNVKALINVSQVAGAKMIKRHKGGSIINLSSISSKRYGQNVGMYSATKAAVNTITRTMAREFGPHKIRVNSVSPGLVLTDMGEMHPVERRERHRRETTLKKLPDIEDCVNAILFLLSDAASGTSGSDIEVDCGFLA